MSSFSLQQKLNITRLLKKAICEIIYFLISLSWERLLFHFLSQNLTALLPAWRRRSFERGKKTEKKRTENQKAVTIYENRYRLLLYAHKFRLPSHFIDLFYNGNQAWLMVRDDWSCRSVCACQRKDTKERQKRKRKPTSKRLYSV